MFKKLLRSVIAPVFWWFLNKKYNMQVEEYGTSFAFRGGKCSIIRKGAEVGSAVELGDYSYISGPRSYVEDAQIGKYCSIARQTTIGVSGHNYEWVTTSLLSFRLIMDLSKKIVWNLSGNVLSLEMMFG
jgi:hypothetical protein